MDILIFTFLDSRLEGKRLNPMVASTLREEHRGSEKNILS
jgi:hypothetical protein